MWLHNYARSILQLLVVILVRLSWKIVPHLQYNFSAANFNYISVSFLS
jgi:hypothetical protein